ITTAELTYSSMRAGGLDPQALDQLKGGMPLARWRQQPHADEARQSRQGGVLLHAQDERNALPAALLGQQRNALGDGLARTAQGQRMAVQTHLAAVRMHQDEQATQQIHGD